MYPAKIGLNSGTVTTVVADGPLHGIYEIWDESTGCRRIVKLYKDKSKDSPSVKRILHFGNAFAKISHPNLVQVYGSGLWNGMPFVEMEYLEGAITLSQILSLRGALPYDIALSIGIMTLDALEYLHTLRKHTHDSTQNGVIHGRFKPSNVLVTRDGVVKLCDYSLEEYQDDTISLEYAAPEQIAHEHLDSNVDMFSWACVFYEMLTGRKTFCAGDEKRLHSQRKKNRYISLSRYKIKISSGVAAIIERNLSSNPRSRTKPNYFVLDHLKAFHGAVTRYPPQENVEFFISSTEGTLCPGVRMITSGSLVSIIVCTLLAGALYLYHTYDFTTKSEMDYKDLFLPDPFLSNGHTQDQDLKHKEEVDRQVKSTQKQEKERDPVESNRTDSKKKDTGVKKEKQSEKVASRRKTETKKDERAENTRKVPDIASPLEMDSNDTLVVEISLLDQLRIEYKTTDLMSILQNELERKNFTRALVVYDSLELNTKKSGKAQLFRMRALRGLNDQKRLELFFGEEEVIDKEYYVVKGIFFYEKRDFRAAILYLQKGKTVTSQFGDGADLERISLYYTALIHSGIYQKTKTSKALETALSSWFNVKYAYRSNQEHRNFKKADQEIRKLSEARNGF